MPSTIDVIGNVLHKNELLLSSCQREAKDLPRGRLCCSRHGELKYYTVKEENRIRYIGRENDEVRNIIKQNYYAKYAETLKWNINVLTKALKKMRNDGPDAIKALCTGAYSDVPEECFHRLGYLPDSSLVCPTSGNSYHAEGLRHLSPSGVYMRSKSEVLIAGIYARLNITAVYEKPLELKSHDLVYPDFTLISKNRKRELYHEHCGMIQDTEYRKAFFAKLNKYILNDLLPFRDVLFTFDGSDGSIDLNAIENMIMFFWEQ